MSRIAINDLSTTAPQITELSQDDLNAIHGEGWKGALIGGIVGGIMGGPGGVAIGVAVGSIVEDISTCKLSVDEPRASVPINGDR